ncbi:hypothetical protein C8Q79DRAFT_991679 [Trametes meyenii]|nr:hypothetical protein C8Q79DRAFT_991679 [Trametes meyenii]
MTSSIGSPSSSPSPSAGAPVRSRCTSPSGPFFCLRFPPSLKRPWHVRGVRLPSESTERRTSARRVYPIPSPMRLTPLGSSGSGCGASVGESVSGRARRRSLLVQLAELRSSSVLPSERPRIDRAWRRRKGDGASSRAESSPPRCRDAPDVELSSSKFRLEYRRSFPILALVPETPSGSVPNSPEVTFSTSRASSSGTVMSMAGGDTASRSLSVSLLRLEPVRRACK